MSLSMSSSEAMAKLTTLTDSALENISEASNSVYNYVTSLDVTKASSPVSQAHALFLFVFSVGSIIGCCLSTTVCVRAARDSNIAMNALNIRRKYHRNMQLYMLVREKMMVEKQVARADNGHTNTSSYMTESRSLTEDQDDEASSSFASSSMADSISYDNGHGHGAVGLINPSDMIMEQSNDDDDSYVDQRPRRCVDLLGDQENISLIEDDYIIVDPITEQYRASNTMANRSNRPSFFEENLMKSSGNSSHENANMMVLSSDQASPQVV